MKLQSPSNKQESYQQKYTRLSDEYQGKPDKLRALLKQLNDEVGVYLNKKRPKPKQLQLPNKDVLMKEQINNIEILKRLKFEFHSQRKRLTILEQKTQKIDLENKINQCEENIRQLATNIEQQKKLNQRQGKEIMQIEEQHGVSPLLIEMQLFQTIQQQSRQIEKSIQEQQFKNQYLEEQIEQCQKMSAQFQQFQSKVKDKVLVKEKQSAAILEQDIQLEQQFCTLQLQLSNQERHKKILEEKFQSDYKLLKSDILHKQKHLEEMENCIGKLHLEIIQINEQCQRLKDHFSMKKSSEIRYRMKNSSKLNQQSFQQNSMDYEEEFTDLNSKQVLSKSFTQPKQIESNLQFITNNENESELEDQQPPKKFSTILEELNVNEQTLKQDQEIQFDHQVDSRSDENEKLNNTPQKSDEIKIIDEESNKIKQSD